jgi:hypothetical protein
MHDRRVERVLIALFERIEIADGRAAFDAPRGADRAGLMQQGLGERGLARAAVPH